LAGVDTPAAISGARGIRLGRKLLALGLTLFVAACATGPKVQDDGTTVRTEVGLAGCSGCTEIRMFTSRELASELYAVRDVHNALTGAHMSASLSLGISNRKSGIVGGLSAEPSPAYLVSITGAGAHMFEQEALTDATHPYRLFLRVHHNSSFRQQNVQLVEGDKFETLPAMHFDGVATGQDCFATGCVWDADYVISAKVIKDHIAAGIPLQVFIGNHQSRQVPSKDGLNPSYEAVNAGAFLKISVTQLQNFISSVHQNLTH
jgi:hypothetical protein